VQLNGTQCVLILHSICLQKEIVLMSVCNVAADIDDCLRADCKVLFYFTCFILTTISRHSHGTLRVSRKANFCICFIVGTVSRHGTLRVSLKENLCDFRGVLSQESTRNDAIEAWRRVSCLLPLAGPTRCCSMARIGRYLVGGPGDVGATLCRGRPSCLRKCDSGEKKAPVLLRTSHAPSEFASYDRKIPFPGSLQVVNSHATRVNRPVTEHLVSQSPLSHSKRLLST